MHFQPEWCRVTLASIGEAVITTDAEGRVTFLNPVAESLTGWTQQEAEGQPLDSVFRIINNESRQPVESPADRALREGVLVGLANHSLLIAKDGTERPIDDSAAPIRNDHGEVAGVVLVFRDVTERTNAERALQKALAYADDIIATIRQPFVVLDPGLRVRTANRSFYESFHVSKDETMTRSLFDLGNRQWDIPALRRLLVEVGAQGRPFEDFEVEHEFPLLGRRSMLVNARRFPPESDDPELILVGIEDITERRRAEAALRDSELQYRRLFETARDGILILDAGTGKITDANPYITEVLGYPREELVGKGLWQIGLFRDIEASRAAFRQLQERGYIRYDNLPLETKGGRRAEVEFVSNVYPIDSKLVIQCNIRDITERRQLEQARVRAEALADMNRRKDEFLAMLSHELRNPLAPIMNGVRLLGLNRGTEDPIQQQARTIIEGQVGQLKTIVDELLEVSHFTTGRITLRQGDVDLRSVVGNAVESVRTQLEERKHELTVSLPPEPVWLHADAARLEQVVVNLLTNAAKYTDPTGRIGLDLKEEGQEAVLRVRDSGVGIAPDLLPHIFDLFTQAERSLDRSQGGLGIGLTMVRRLVELHGGKVDVHSELGLGSEFVVRLPVRPATEQPSPTQEKSS